MKLHTSSKLVEMSYVPGEVSGWVIIPVPSGTQLMRHADAWKDDIVQMASEALRKAGARMIEGEGGEAAVKVGITLAKLAGEITFEPVE